MVHENPNNGEQPDLRNPNNGEAIDHRESTDYTEEPDSACSTPYVSAPSSPGRGPSRCFFSAPASPMHFVLASFGSSSSCSGDQFVTDNVFLEQSGSYEFEFDQSTARHSDGSGWIGGSSMSSADELFLNGQIRPMKLLSHLQRPQMLEPLDLEDEGDDEKRKDSRGRAAEVVMIKREDSFGARSGRDLRFRGGMMRSLHRRTRSLSPLRNNPPFQWHEDDVDDVNPKEQNNEQSEEMIVSEEATPSVSASSSRSSSSGRSSKRWVFLKDFLRSKSEGRANAKEKFWYAMSFSPTAKEKKSSSHQSSKETKKSSQQRSTQVSGKKTNSTGKRRQSPHEMHYTANRAQSEEMRKRTFLPYRQGLLGCLGFSSKSYGAMNGFARALNPVSSSYQRLFRGTSLVGWCLYLEK